jgi:hypothetical protein
LLVRWKINDLGHMPIVEETAWVGNGSKAGPSQEIMGTGAPVTVLVGTGWEAEIARRPGDRSRGITLMFAA